jgi:hypothetical protein
MAKLTGQAHEQAHATASHHGIREPFVWSVCSYIRFCTHIVVIHRSFNRHVGLTALFEEDYMNWKLMSVAGLLLIAIVAGVLGILPALSSANK